MSHSFDQRLEEIFKDSSKAYEEKFQRRREYLKKSNNKTRTK